MHIETSQGRMAAYLGDHQDKVISRWCELVAAGLRGRSSTVEIRAELEDLYALVLRVMAGPGEQGPGELRAALAELSRSRARNGFTPRETALGVFALKDAVYELIADTADLVPEYLSFSRMIDDLGLHTFESYAAAREQIIADQAASMLELSTPVVRLWDGIIAVPLVGTLDSARTQLVTEKLLETLVVTGAEHAVLDITGVPTVDTEVAQHLLKTVNAARLLGAECTISGIRPQVARQLAGPKVTLQGNFDPAKLVSPIPVIEREVRAMLDAFGGGPHIANLGHGILPNIPVDHARAFVETVKNYAYEPAR